MGSNRVISSRPFPGDGDTRRSPGWAQTSIPSEGIPYHQPTHFPFLENRAVHFPDVAPQPAVKCQYGTYPWNLPPLPPSAHLPLPNTRRKLLNHYPRPNDASASCNSPACTRRVSSSSSSSSTEILRQYLWR